ncbi:MAG: amidophosphoribosyltransferase, partial [bacterium]|nr:amidophosphoribosyltransferase [bacterium]
VKQIEKYLGVDSLRYLSLEGMLAMPSLPDTTFCHGCFSGKYPIKVPKSKEKNKLDVNATDTIRA